MDIASAETSLALGWGGGGVHGRNTHKLFREDILEEVMPKMRPSDSKNIRHFK